MRNTDALTADEVAKILRVSRNTVYNLVKRDELASYYVGRKMRFSLADVENYIARASASAASGAKARAHGVILPPDAAGAPAAASGGRDAAAASASPATPSAAGDAAVSPRFFSVPRRMSYVIAGNDIVGDMMANYLGTMAHDASFERVYEGSYAALADAYAGRAHAALVHLYDRDGGYNVSFVRRMLPGTPVRLVRLVGRRQGLIVGRGNPKGLRSWADLGRDGVRLSNRERGCGSRVLLDEKLMEHGIDRAGLAGYGREHPSALAAAALVARGAADACIGSERAFHQVEGVDFLPLQDEWLDVALVLSPATSAIADALCRLARTRSFRDEVAQMTGYDVSRMGEVVLERL